jgi:hypothetical protein
VFVSPLLIKLMHYSLNTSEETLFELLIILVSCANNCLVMNGVLHVHVCVQFVLIKLEFLSRGATINCIRVTRTIEIRVQFGKVNLEDGGAESSKLAGCSAVQILIALLGHQVLYVFVLLLADLISR